MPSDSASRRSRSNYTGFRSEQWLTLREVVENLGVHRLTVGNYLRSGALPGVKLGGAVNSHWRVPVEAVDAFLAGDQATLRAIAADLPRQPARRTSMPPASRPSLHQRTGAARHPAGPPLRAGAPCVQRG